MKADIEYSFIDPEGHEIYVDRSLHGDTLSVSGNRDAITALGGGLAWALGPEPFRYYAADPGAAYTRLLEEYWECWDLSDWEEEEEEKADA